MVLIFLSVLCAGSLSSSTLQLLLRHGAGVRLLMSAQLELEEAAGLVNHHDRLGSDHSHLDLDLLSGLACGGLPSLGRRRRCLLHLLEGGLVGVLVGRPLVDYVHLELHKLALLSDFVNYLILLFLHLVLLLGLCTLRIRLLSLRVNLDLLLLVRLRELKQHLISDELRLVVGEHARKLEGAALDVYLALTIFLPLIEFTLVHKLKRIVALVLVRGGFTQRAVAVLDALDYLTLVVRAVTVQDGALAVGPVIAELPRVGVLVLRLECALAVPDIEVPLALVPELGAAVPRRVDDLPVAVLLALVELPSVNRAVREEALSRARDLAIGEVALVATAVFHQEDTLA